MGPGETIRLDIWNGWANILNHAMKGDVRRFTNSLSKVEKVAKVRFMVDCSISPKICHKDFEIP